MEELPMGAEKLLAEDDGRVEEVEPETMEDSEEEAEQDNAAQAPAAAAGGINQSLDHQLTKWWLATSTSTR